MNVHDSTDIKFILYHNNKPISVCRPSYLGLLGMSVNVKNINLPKNSDLEIEVMGPEKIGADDSRIPVVVSSSSSKGMGLRLKSFNDDNMRHWRQILSRVLNSDQIRKNIQ